MTEEKTDEKNAAAAANPEADMQERIDGFNKEVQPLLGKFELGLGALPFINPNGTIGANPVIVSMRGRGSQTTEAEKPAPLE